MKGLSSKEALELQKFYGKNEISISKKESSFIKIIKIICEPMFLLLIIAALIYFILGEFQDGFIMLIFIVAVILIEIVQELKTDHTLESLKELSTPTIMVYRDGQKKEIVSTDLVPGDIMEIYEGVKIPADGFLLKESGLSVDESTLTGEVLGVFKTLREDHDNYFKKNYCYAGTLVIQGSGLVKVTKIGNNTEYGKIGASLINISNEKTPLQKQVSVLVKYSIYLALALFLLVFIITFINLDNYSLGKRIIQSLLPSITVAIALIPEEFPVVLTVFLSMGAWRLAKQKSIVKKLPSVETLGSISTLCVDKTGTITQNKMQVKKIWSYNNNNYDLVFNMHMACGELVYDPMEKAMIKYAKEYTKKDHNKYEKIIDYPFNNDLKVMGVVKKYQNKYLLSSKGSTEGILDLCALKHLNKEIILKEAKLMAEEGLRVIAIAKKEYKLKKDLPTNYDEFDLDFLGLIGLYDPPKKGIVEDIKGCYGAGINVIMITGDNGVTASAIAKQVGIKNYNHVLTGEQIDLMSDEELYKNIKTTSIFSRVIPEHKLRIVKALKKHGEIVAMTGDGVNDALALKYADIGIAMGGRGSDVSREAADLILLDDNFSTITNTIKDGRRIYDNIKKAFGYIISIHVPIALSSLMAPILGILPQNLLLLPVHIVLLELIIDPTCSIVLERIPAESDIMYRKPRKLNSIIINLKEFLYSFSEGLLLFLGAFIIFYLYSNSGNVILGRTMGILIIMIGNIFLVNVCSNKRDYAINSVKYLLKDKVFVIVNLTMLIILSILLYSPLSSVFKFQSLNFKELFLVIIISFACTFIFEIKKLVKKRN